MNEASRTELLAIVASKSWTSVSLRWELVAVVPSRRTSSRWMR